MFQLRLDNKTVRYPAGPLSRFFAVLCLCTVVLFSFFTPASAASKAPITLYAGQHQQLVRMIVSAFEKQTGIHVKVRQGEGPELANQIIQEGKQSPADVYFTENSPELMRLEEKGLLAPVDKHTLNQVPSRYNSPKGDWVGVLARENVLTYDPKLINKSRLPNSLMDLVKPRWKGKIAIAPSDSDFLPLVRAVVVKEGRSQALKWLKGLKRNAQIYQDNEGVAAAVNKGAVAVGIINNYYWYRLRQQVGRYHMQSRLYHFSHGNVGALVNISGAGVLKSARHPQEAQRLLAFMVRKSTQRMVAHSDVDFEYPLHPGVTANPQLKPFKKLRPPSITVGQLGDNHQAMQLLQQVGLL